MRIDGETYDDWLRRFGGRNLCIARAMQPVVKTVHYKQYLAQWIRIHAAIEINETVQRLELKDAPAP